MKFDLQIPFSEDYKSGYLLINKEPRRLVLLVRNDGTKTSISYARYLYSCKIGQYLDKTVQVDHIDNDKMNDVIENLQLLSPIENLLKSKKSALLFNFICPICKKEFTLTKQRACNKINPTCSRSCGGKKSHITKSQVQVLLGPQIINI